MEVIGHLGAPAALSLRKIHKFLLVRRLDGSQRRSGSGGEEENLFPPSENELSVLHNLVKILIEQLRLFIS
jgi:hypothetical protein